MGKTGRATVKIIREGYFRWIEKRSASDVTCTSTCIDDGGKRIIVDVPNTGEEQAFLEALEAEGIEPSEVDYVVVTHFHPDHSGCLHLFPNAIYVGSGVKWRGAKHEYWHEDALVLTDDVYVLKTPGHTPDSCSVIADTEKGVIAMVGDMWWSLKDPRLLVVSDEDALEKNRNMIISLADKLVPGHAGMGSSKDVKL